MDSITHWKLDIWGYSSICIVPKLELIYLAKMKLEVEAFVLTRKEDKRKRMT